MLLNFVLFSLVQVIELVTRLVLIFQYFYISSVDIFLSFLQIKYLYVLKLFASRSAHYIHFSRVDACMQWSLVASPVLPEFQGK